MFQIDPMSRTPVYEQIVAQAEKLISAGLLRPGDQLPSVRSLSVELSVNPNTIQRSYTTLDTMGLVVSVPGRGCFVSENARDAVAAKNRGRLSELRSLAAELCMAGISPEEIVGAAEDGVKSITERKETL